jgi:SAM-dependent methyltransferase/ribosomal protein S18 acetylase RimI-like enzyme
MNSLEFHRRRYAEEFALDELRWSRIRPCLRMIQAEQRKRGCRLAILDVGCGDSTVSRLFLEVGHSVFGVDIVPEFVEQAIEKGIKARVADVTQDGLPFPAKAMDVIYAGALIEHLYDPEFWLRECHRVLKAEGILVLSTPNIASLTSRLRMLFGKGPKFQASALSWPFGGHIRMFTAGTLKRLLEENGFAVDEITSNLVSFIPTRVTRRPWSVTLGKFVPDLGEVLITKARKRLRGGSRHAAERRRDVRLVAEEGTDEVIIRAARPSEAEAIHQVLGAAFRGLRGRGYSRRALEAAIVPPEEIGQRLAQGCHVLVAEAGRQVVGTATGIEEHEALHVCSVAVHPDWQGQRIARRMMEVLEGLARQRGCHKLWLQTAWTMTEAIALYKRLGYQQEGYQPRQFYGEDFFVFGKVLSDT